MKNSNEVIIISKNILIRSLKIVLLFITIILLIYLYLLVMFNYNTIIRMELYKKFIIIGTLTIATTTHNIVVLELIN